MRRLLILALLLVIPALLAGAQEAQRTPPGGDTVGSDRNLQRGDIRTTPSPSPDQNQVMTNSNGTNSGYENNPAYAGQSTDESRTRQGTGGTVGMQGQTAATAGRRRAHSGSGNGAPPGKTVNTNSAQHGRKSNRTNAHARRRTKRRNTARPAGSNPPPR